MIGAFGAVAPPLAQVVPDPVGFGIVVVFPVVEEFVAAVVPKFWVDVGVPKSPPPETFNTWLTGEAAATLLFPAWLAVMVVTPAATAITLVPLIVATFVLALEYDTANPELAVAVRALVVPAVTLASAPNVMV
jgi:hypothetical protein